MHVWTHLKEESYGKTGIGIYPDGMVEHDGFVGEVLKKLEDLGIADDTIVVYSTDNGAETVSWPDDDTTPFHGEKGTTWEGGFRVPLLVCWPRVIKPDTIYTDIISQEDWMPTLGLLHGLGFAGALNEVGLHQQAIPLALLFFLRGGRTGAARLYHRGPMPRRRRAPPADARAGLELAGNTL